MLLVDRRKYRWGRVERRECREWGGDKWRREMRSREGRVQRGRGYQEEEKIGFLFHQSSGLTLTTCTPPSNSPFLLFSLSPFLLPPLFFLPPQWFPGTALPLSLSHLQSWHQLLHAWPQESNTSGWPVSYTVNFSCWRQHCSLCNREFLVQCYHVDIQWRTDSWQLVWY